VVCHTQNELRSLCDVLVEIGSGKVLGFTDPADKRRG
jgi:hypothetical protein